MTIPPIVIPISLAAAEVLQAKHILKKAYAPTNVIQTTAADIEDMLEKAADDIFTPDGNQHATDAKDDDDGDGNDNNSNDNDGGSTSDATDD